MKDLVLIDSVPAKIELNLEEFRASAREEIKKCDVVVTVDTVKDAKVIAADLNKRVKELGDKFKEVNKIVSAPINAVGAQVKEVQGEFLEARTRITDQIAKFEDARKEIARQVLEVDRLELWDSMAVQEEFRKCSVNGLVKLGALTSKDQLTSATFRELKAMVEADKALQTQTENRVLMLENECYKAGLKAPLTRSHIEGFLFADELAYKENLERLIESELGRQKAIEEKVSEEQKQVEVVVQEEAEVRNIEINCQVVNEEVAPAREPEPEELQQILTSDIKEQRRTINVECKKALMALGADSSLAESIVKAAVLGELGAMRIYY